jgi:hypothetical protein
MNLFTCAGCFRGIHLPEDGRLPPWCPHCGADFKMASGWPFTPAGSLVSPAPTWSTAKPESRTAFSDKLPDASQAPSEEAQADPNLAVDFPPTPSEGWRQLNLGALALGGVLLLICLVLSNRSVDKLTTHHKVQGRVVQLTVGRKGRIYPEVAYTFGGKTYHVRSSSSSSSSRIGDPVELFVPPNDPDQATINSFSEMWLGSVLTGLLGAGCLWIGLAGRPRAKAAEKNVYSAPV